MRVQPPFHGDWDDALEKLPASAALTTRGLLRVDVWLQENAALRPLTLAVVESLHRMAFGGVFPDFAGRLRGEPPRYIPQNVTFDPHRGVPYERVPGKCAALFRRVAELTAQLDTLATTATPDNFADALTTVAAYTHSEFVRIHPFRNGNGRTARVCVNYFPRRFGLLPLTYERPDAGTGYLAATDAWLSRRDPAPFVAFLRPRLMRLTDNSE